MSGLIASGLVWAFAAASGVNDSSAATVAVRWEQTLTSSRDYANPYHDVTLHVTFDGPGGRRFAGYGFWDGKQTFRVRAAFPVPGVWTWTTRCSDTANAGLHGQRGTVNVANYAGDNRLYRHGFLQVSENGRYVTHADGTPFLWIGDTPWAAFIAATQDEWERYFDNRKSNQFTVIQVHCGSGFQKLTKDRLGNPPFLGSGASLHWNPAYWRQVDEKVRAANDRGLVVYICAVRQPGADFPMKGFPPDDAQQVRLFARSLAARLMGDFVIYSPIADDLWSPAADAAGEALREATSVHLISAHPRFFLEPALESHGKAYIDVVGLQTGEGWTYDPYKKEPRTPFSTQLAARNAFEWPLKLYKRSPVKPVINQEGPYDHPLEASGRVPLPPHKAGYWSFLSGAAGHTYGCFGIFNWGVPVRWMPEYDFQTALHVPSVAHMKHLAEFFSSIPWWTLEPHAELVQNQPADPMQRMGFAKSASGDLAVAYLPDNSEIKIDMQTFPGVMRAKWFDPIAGRYESISEKIPPMGRRAFTRPAAWTEAVLLLVRQTSGG